MANRLDVAKMLSPQFLLNAYANGYFPMAGSGATIDWYEPEPRAIIPLDSYKPSRSLRPVLNRGEYKICINRNFRTVIEACALPRHIGDSTWISKELIEAYCKLHLLGYAHSVESYLADELVGGLYGVSVGGAFFGESMFYKKPNASKIAFHYLIERLKAQSFSLLDTQFMNENVKRFGAIEIPKENYKHLLQSAIQKNTSFVPDKGLLSLKDDLS